MEKKDFKKVFQLVVLTIIIYWAINNLAVINSFISKITEILFPFILGGALAFILNIPMAFFEKKIARLKNGKKPLIKNKSFLRTISLILAIIVIALVFFLIIKLITSRTKTTLFCATIYETFYNKVRKASFHSRASELQFANTLA